MPSLGEAIKIARLNELQFGYDDLISIYDMSERKVKATSFRDLIEAYGFYGTSVIDALRSYKIQNTASGEPPINDQLFTQTDGTDTTSTLTYNANCWAARFDLTGTAWHASDGGSKRAHLVGPRAVVFADHYEPSGDITFTNAQGQRFTYSFATGTASAGGITYQPTHALGNDAKVGVLSADVDSSLRIYDIATSLQPNEYVLQTRSRESSTTQTPYKQRVHFDRVSGQTYLTDPKAAITSSTTKVYFSHIAYQLGSFSSYWDARSSGDSGDATFQVGDDGILKLVSTNATTSQGPFYGNSTLLSTMDTFLSAWGTTRGGRDPY